jgi:CBS domain-containing protein
MVRFLAEHSPIDALEPDRLQHVAGRAQIEFYPEGSTILEGDESARMLYVVRAGAVEVVDGGRVLDLLGEGDVFGGMGSTSPRDRRSSCGHTRTPSAT